jgi:hypothetical protein
MIRGGFLDSESRKDLIELARDGSAAHRLARRANALVLLLDDDTIRTWYRLYQEDGIEGLASFGDEDGACRLSEQQQDKLTACRLPDQPVRTGGSTGMATLPRPLKGPLCFVSVWTGVNSTSMQ